MKKKIFIFYEKKKSTKRKTSFYFDRKYFKMDRRAEIQKILFHGSWMNYSQLGSCREFHKRCFQYYIYCFSEAPYRKCDQRFPDFLFLKECF